MKSDKISRHLLTQYQSLKKQDIKGKRVSGFLAVTEQQNLHANERSNLDTLDSTFCRQGSNRHSLSIQATPKVLQPGRSTMRNMTTIKGNSIDTINDSLGSFGPGDSPHFFSINQRSSGFLMGNSNYSTTQPGLQKLQGTSI